MSFPCPRLPLVGEVIHIRFFRSKTTFGPHELKVESHAFVDGLGPYAFSFLYQGERHWRTANTFGTKWVFLLDREANVACACGKAAQRYHEEKTVCGICYLLVQGVPHDKILH